MGYGMFAFGALGDSYFAFGALAGLYAAVLAGIACVALGDRTTMIYAPRVTTTFFLGALLHNLVDSNVAGLRDGGAGFGSHLGPVIGMPGTAEVRPPSTTFVTRKWLPASSSCCR